MALSRQYPSKAEKIAGFAELTFGMTPELAAARAAIAAFLETAARPALVEPGETPMLLHADCFLLDEQASRLVLQAWDNRRNLVRRVRATEKIERGKVSLSVERFGGRPGTLILVDLAHPRKQDWARRGARMVFRERFRKMLSREFPGWQIAEVSTEADLQHSLSPAYPRALLTRGATAMAAISAPPECLDFPGMLSFGLIWLDYVRRRNPKRSVELLTFWAPSPVASQLSFYLPVLDGSRARFEMYVYSDEDFTRCLDARDYGNVATELDPCRAVPEAPPSIEHAEAVPHNDGAVSLRVAGLEFARFTNGRLSTGNEPADVDEVRALAANLAALRHPAADRSSVIYQQNPEAWLESLVRSHLPTLDASLRLAPVYGQVPAIAGQNRTVLDLLAVDHAGRLAVLELKASQDLHLPLQALDYWLRVKWHLERGEFTRYGYFPGVQLRTEPPRLLLIAPSLEFHPSSEVILGFLKPDIEVTRIGLSADWRIHPRIMFRLTGAERPVTT